MADALERLSIEIADLRRRLHALETAPRAPLTSIDSGGLTIAAGGSLNVPNEDGTGSVLNVEGGELHFPIGLGAWRPTGGVITYSTVGNGAAMTFVTVLETYISIGSNTLDGEFDFLVTGTGNWLIHLTARAVGGVHDGTAEDPAPTEAKTGILFASFEVSASGIESGPWTLPNTLWAPAGHPGGTVAEVIMWSQRESGTGSCTVLPTKPLMSV